MAKKNKGSDAPTEQTASGDLQFTIQGQIFSLAPRYAAGHVVSLVEANTLNQVLIENLRNNFASSIKTAKDAAEKAGTEVDVEALRTKFAEYASAYVFQGVRRAAPVDPIGKEEHKLAKEAVLALLRKKGHDPKTVSTDKMDELVAAIKERRPEIREEAERRVAARQSAAESDIGDLLDDVAPAAAAAA